MKILATNWQDLENPHAGGAELHLFELMQRLVGLRHQVHLVCSGWPGAAPRAVVHGVSVERHGGRHSFAALGRGAVRAALGRESWDLALEAVSYTHLTLPTIYSV